MPARLREAAARVHLVAEHARDDPGVALHDRLDLISRRVEDADAAQLGAVHHRAHDVQHAVGAEAEVAAAVLPDDLASTLVVYAGPW